MNEKRRAEEDDDESDKDLKDPAQISIEFDELNHVGIGLSCFLIFNMCRRTIRRAELARQCQSHPGFRTLAALDSDEMR
jgi:hypothetical protein